ncbi:immunoglobulin I-set domain protein, partial [Teladorsagia circumcincta]
PRACFQYLQQQLRYEKALEREQIERKAREEENLLIREEQERLRRLFERERAERERLEQIRRREAEERERLLRQHRLDEQDRLRRIEEEKRLRQLQTTGVPPPTLEWCLVDGTPIKDGGKFKIEHGSAGDSKLIIEKGRVVVQSRQKLGPAHREQVTLRKVDRRMARTPVPVNEMQDRAASKSAPVFSSKPQTMNLIEGQTARLEFKYSPADDPNMKIVWLLNGKPITLSSRVTTINEKGLSILEINPVTVFDQGEYTVVLVNPLGEARNSVVINVMGHTTVDQPTLGNSFGTAYQSRSTRAPPGIQLDLPNFHSDLRSHELFEGQPIHLEAKLTPLNDPNLVVVWYLNGRELMKNDRCHQTLNHGFATLDILNSTKDDSGVFTCRAINKLGESENQATVIVHPRVDLHKYEHNRDLDVDDVREIQYSHAKQDMVPKFLTQTFNNFGVVSLSLNPTYPDDAGTYTCVLFNANGQAQSSAELTTIPMPTLQLDTKHQDSLQIIGYLDSHQVHIGPQEVDRPEEFQSLDKPKFVRPLAARIECMENDPVHFEARLQPANDVKMTVEWYHNGAPLAAAHRFRPMFDFGYVALDILYAYPEDSGTYTLGPLGESYDDDPRLVTIELEQDRHIGLPEVEDRTCDAAPQIIGNLNDLELNEHDDIHVDVKVTPVNDPTMKVEWFVNGHPLITGSRVKTLNEFGFIALDIKGAIAEDSGDYSLRVSNALGEAIRQCKINVKPSKEVVLDTHHEESLDKINYLENLDKYGRREIEEHGPDMAPVFVAPLEADMGEVEEGEPIHLECQVKPINDNTLKVTWLRNGAPIPHGHRFRTFYDFGFVSLDILGVYPQDSGEYTCKAENALGSVETKTKIDCKPKDAILGQVQHPKSYQRIQEIEAPKPKPQELPEAPKELKDDGKSIVLELYRTTYIKKIDIICRNAAGEAQSTVDIDCRIDAANYRDSFHPTSLQRIKELETPLQRVEPAPEKPKEVPQILRGLPPKFDIVHESQTLHLEVQVSPIDDNTLKYQWLFNGQPLKASSRYRLLNDFGYITLDIDYVIAEDAGKYTLVIENEAARRNIYLDTQHESSWAKIQEMENRQEIRPPSPEMSFPPPTFTEQLQNIDEATEADAVRLDCRLVPVNDPTLKVTWTVNGQPIPEASRFMPARNFDYVSLDILGLYPEDSGVYTCKAVSDFGEAATSCTVKCTPIKALMLDPQHEQSWMPPKFVVPLPGKVDDVAEGTPIHLEAEVIPTNDNKLTVQWFHNGAPLVNGHRFRTAHDFGHVAMDILYAFGQDSGEWTCVAKNELALALGFLERYRKVELEAPKIQPEEAPEKEHDKPQFLEPMESLERIEFQPAHFETRLQPVADPNMVVQWYKDGRPLHNGNRFKLTSDFGYVALDIAHTIPEDSGVYAVKAINKKGEESVEARLAVRANADILSDPQHDKSWQKIQQLEAPRAPGEEAPEVKFGPPKWTRQLNSCEDVIEGQPAHFEAQFEPFAHPQTTVQWFLNGKPLSASSRRILRNDFGLATLDLQYVLGEDIGEYNCVVRNPEGEDRTTGKLSCIARPSILAETMHDQSWKRIQDVGEVNVGETVNLYGVVGPSDDPNLRVEWFHNGKPLQNVLKERLPLAPPSKFQVVEEVEEVIQREMPRFITQLQPVEGIQEGQPIHLEATFEPTRDPDMEVVWRKNGQPIIASQLVQTHHELGWATLDIPMANEDHNGIYTVTIKNSEGMAVSTAPVKVTNLAPVLGDTRHEESWRRIQILEAPREPEPEAPARIYDPPFITTQLEDKECNEGDRVHFEAVYGPVDDPNLQVQWVRNGQPLAHGSKYAISKDFGISTLDIAYAFPEDQGVYQVRVLSPTGEAVSSATLKCHGKDAILGDTQHAESWARIQEIEAPKPKMEEVEPAPKAAPKFIKPIQSPGELIEGQPAHFEATVEPVDDPNLQITWLLNGVPMPNSSRVKTINDFGWVIMDINQVEPRDTGEWTCVAKNPAGEAQCKAPLTVVSKENIVRDTLNPQSLDRIREIEADKPAAPEAPAPVYPAPQFTAPLTVQGALEEAGSAHLQAQFTPIDDPNLKVEWLRDGQPIFHSNRYRMVHDFGFAVLDIIHLLAHDTGEYTCRISNQAGEAVSSAPIKVAPSSGLILHPQNEQKAKAVSDLEEILHRKPEEAVVEVKEAMPVFIEPLSAPVECDEGDRAHFTARYEPLNDNKLQVQWFHDGRPLKTGSRVKTLNDFGFVVLEISPVYPEDSGEYSCRARNLVGEAVTSTRLTCNPKERIIRESQLPGKMAEGAQARIGEIEAPRPAPEEGPEVDYGPPKFTTQLAPPPELLEGQMAHLEAQITPVLDPSLKIEWFHDGKPMKHSNRMKMIHDFGFVVLELSPSEPQDTGKWTCRATNKKGTDEVSCDIKVVGTGGVSYEWLSPAERKDRINELEHWIHRPKEELQLPQVDYGPPKFTQNLTDLGTLNEADATAFVCVLEPIGDPTLRVHWEHNGHPIPYSNRFKPVFEFGFCSLDILYAYPEDNGVYELVVTNDKGEARTKSQITVLPRPALDYSSQTHRSHQDNLESHFRQYTTMGIELTPGDIYDEAKKEAPVFKSPLQNIGVAEGEFCRFETQLAPINDPYMKIEWFKDKKPVLLGHRFRSTMDFGFVCLDLLYALPDDTGEYTCVATNKYDFREPNSALPGFTAVRLVPEMADKNGGHRYKLNYDGLHYLTISNCRISDAGEVLAIARNSEGEVQATCTLDIFQKKDFRQQQLKPAQLKSHEEIQQRQIQWQKETLGKLGEAFEAAPKPDALKLMEVERTRPPFEPLETEELVSKFTRPRDDQFYSQLSYVEAQKPPFKGMELEPVQLKPGHVERYQPPREGLEPVDLRPIPSLEKPVPQPEQPDWAQEGGVRLPGNVEGRFKKLATPPKEVEVPARDQVSLKVAKPKPASEVEIGEHVRIAEEKAKLKAVQQGPEQPKEEIIPHKQQVELKTKFQPIIAKPGESVKIDSKPLKEIPPVEKPLIEMPTTISNKHEHHHVMYQAYRESRTTVAGATMDHLSVDLDEHSVQRTVYQFSPRPRERIVSFHMVRPQPTKIGASKQAPPTVSQQLKPIQGEPGKAAKFFVAFDGALPIKVTWFKDGKEIKSSFRNQITTTNNGSTLHIGRLENNHIGEYMARLENVAGTIETSANLTLTAPAQKGKAPDFATKLNDLRIVQNAPAVFTCTIIGEPKPTVNWFKDGQPLPNIGRFQATETNGQYRLSISNILPQDVGVYECVAKNPAGEARCKARLNVNLTQTGKGSEEGPRYEAPRFTTQIQPLIVDEGKSATFTAKFTGFPDPAIRWYRNNEPIKRSAGHEITQTKDEAKLTITAVQQEDVAEYKVEASNPAGKASSVANLVLTLISPLVKVGSSVLVRTRATITLEGKRAVLEIARVTHNQAGEYQIVIRNPKGAAQCKARLILTNHVYEYKTCSKILIRSEIVAVFLDCHLQD